jgi:hypothetical protein
MRQFFAAGLILVVSFVGGMVFVYGVPQTAAPVLRALDLGRTLVVLTARTAFTLPPSTAEQETFNQNTFEVHTTSPDLKGTVLLALRAPQWQWDYFQSRIVEVNRQGKVVWEYRIQEHEPGLVVSSDVRKLPNGHVLFPAARPNGRKVFSLYHDAFKLPEGLEAYSFTVVLEVDRDGKTVRKWQTPVTHHAELLTNGNLLTVSSHQDVAREITPEGKLVWEWDAAKQIQAFQKENFIGFEPGFVQNFYIWHLDASDWTHLNAAQRLANGNTLLSLRNLDLVIEVDPQGKTVWSYGPLVLKHQHCAWVLENGHLLVTDNGNARVIEVDRATQQVVWEYSEGLKMLIEGCAYRLPSGNTLITDSGNYRILEVTPDKKKVWELAVKTPVEYLYRAWWSPE